MTDKKRTRAPGGGRKPIAGEPKQRISIMLTPATRAKAAEIGNGSVSEGIRMAVEAFQLSE